MEIALKDKLEQIRSQQLEIQMQLAGEDIEEERNDYFRQINKKVKDLNLYGRISDYKHLSKWRKAFAKLRIDILFKNLHDDILIYGTNYQYTPQDIDFDSDDVQKITLKQKFNSKRFFVSQTQIFIKSLPWYIITQGCRFKKVWNSVLVVVLLYTATVMPYRVAFHSPQYWDWWTILDTIVDILFWMDIFVNFCSSYQKLNGTHITDLKRISINYLRSWFVFDFLACFPFGLIEHYFFNDGETDEQEQSSNLNSLVRLIRLPRLYRLLRVVRLFKVFEGGKQDSILERLQDFLQVNTRMVKLFTFLISTIFLVHILGCFWYLSARIQNFNTFTWVYQGGYMDESNQTLYLISIYWAFTTITQVGYGDITPAGNLGRFICIICMGLGVFFYSYTIGSLSSFLYTINSKDSLLSLKMAALREFALETGISRKCKNKLRQAIKFNINRQGTVWGNKHSLFNELPRKLKIEVILSMYNGFCLRFPLLKNQDPSFQLAIIPLMSPLFLDYKAYVYELDKHADEVYFITLGQINIVLGQTEVPYKSYLRSSYFGEIEIFMNCNRLEFTQCAEYCEFLYVKKSDFLQVMNEFPKIRRNAENVAVERYFRNQNARADLITALKTRLGHEKFKEMEEQKVKFLQNLIPPNIEIEQLVLRIMDSNRGRLFKGKKQVRKLDSKVKQLTKMIKKFNSYY